MAPKGGKGAAAKHKPQEEQREDILQAVVLADSFEKRFQPFTKEKPRCLLPLANTPLIEYTLEFLAHAGVEEIFICCGNHTEQLEAYIEASKWKQSSSPFTSLVLVRSPATTVGDALRDLAGRDAITHDFLLVAGDVVSNIAIEPALTGHRARRKKDNNAIMTMILREAGPAHRTKPKSCRPVFFIDETNDRCLHYEEINRKRNGKHCMNLDADLLKQHQEIDIRGDLLDCHIDICTPDVLALWSDNFDYQSMRTSFLYGVLKDYELNGKTIHVHIESKGYAARVRSLRAYDAITRDIIDRWTYPLTPDCNFFQGQTYTLGKNKNYKERGVVLARGSLVQNRCIVGTGTSIGDRSTISNSVIGRRCQIGRNVSIRNSYIWDDVVIDDNTIVDHAIIASEASIAKSCTVSSGSMISFGTQIPASTTLEPSSISTRTSSTTIKSGSSQPPKTPTTPASDAYSSGSESDASANLLSLSPTPSFLSTDSISTLASESDPDIDALSLASGAYTDDDDILLDPSTNSQRTTAQQKDFLADAAVSIYEQLTAGEGADKIRLELVAQRMAADATPAQVRDALVEGLMKRVWALIDGTTGKGEKVSPGAAATQVFGDTELGLLLQQMGNFNDTSEGQKNQISVLSKVEESCMSKEKGSQVLLFVVKELVDGESVQEEGVFGWWEAGSGDDEQEEVRKLTEQYVDLLRDAGDDSDSEEEEESEEDDDDDE